MTSAPSRKKSDAAAAAQPAPEAAPADGLLFGRLSERRYVLILLAVTLVGSMFFTGIVLQYVGGPLIAPGDTPGYELGPYYFLHNLRFTPWPQLDLKNDQFLYPYGSDNVFITGVFGLCFFVGTLQSVVGPGPWVQLAFLLSLLIAGAGSYLLLRGEYGPLPATFVALASSFGNFYALDTYPEHVVCGMAHWSVLSIVYDHVLLRRLWFRKGWPLPLLLGRGVLLFLSVAQMLAYVAGIGLASFVVSGAAAAVIILWRLRHDDDGLDESITGAVKNLTASARRRPWTCVALTAYMALLAFFLIPLNLQVVRESRKYAEVEANQGAFWANPQRMLVPVLPNSHTSSNREYWATSVAPAYSPDFDDMPEKAFDCSVGWYLLIPALAGLALAWRRLPIFLPTLALFVLFLAYHPIDLPTLRIFPWAGFERVTGRFTVVYPTLLAILALGAVEAFRRGPLRLVLRYVFVPAIALLACVEFVTAYAFFGEHKGIFLLDDDFYACMDAVAEAPGEAVLDWPFCVAGGEGNATPQLGVYFNRQSHIQALQRFHGKKVVSQYMGRMPRVLYEPLLRAGWQNMFFPDEGNYRVSAGQWRDFTDDEWRFFDDFFARGDFCGLLLYVDMLPPTTVAEFHRRYGDATHEGVWIDCGRIRFVPKPAALRERVDVAAARTIVHHPPELQRGETIELASDAAVGYLGGGWGPVVDGARRSEGSQTVLRFRVTDKTVTALRLELATVGAREYVVALNGVGMGQVSGSGEWGRPLDVPLPRNLLADDNEVLFYLPDTPAPEVGIDGLRIPRPGIDVRSMRLIGADEADDGG